MKKTLYLIDASSFIYRSFFALPSLKSKEGLPTNAVYGFLKTLMSIIKAENPNYMAIVFDSPAPSKREKIFKDYKAGRPSMPDPLKIQIPIIKRIVPLMGITSFEKEGYEADDLIASIAKKFSTTEFKVKIYTPDKDMLQLVNEKIQVVNPATGEIFTFEKVKRKFGVPPEKIPDYLALVGDKIDNIEGIKGVGPKTAPLLIKEFGGVEGILSRWEEFKKRFPQADANLLRRSYTLVKPMLDTKIEITEEDLLLKDPNLPYIKKELEKLDMKSLIKELEKILKRKKQKSLF